MAAWLTARGDAAVGCGVRAALVVRAAPSYYALHVTWYDVGVQKEDRPMADATCVAAVLARYLAVNPGREPLAASLSPIALADVLRLWLDSAQGRRAILVAAIARVLKGTEG